MPGIGLPARRERRGLEHLKCGSYHWVYSKDGSGPPLLLIHGLSGSVRWWRRNIPELARHFTVYAVELQGFAGNRRGRPLSFTASADSLAAFMEAIGVDRAHVVGHSMGGHISLYLAVHHPERVNRLVLAAPSGMIRRALARMALRLAQYGHYEALSFAPTVVVDALRAGPVNLLLAARAILRDDVEEMLASVSATTLVMAGERDPLVPAASCAQFAEIIPRARLVVLEGAAHNLMWSHHTAFNRAVLEFLLEPKDDPPAQHSERVEEQRIDRSAGSET